jgi:VWFA-related protein
MQRGQKKMRDADNGERTTMKCPRKIMALVCMALLSMPLTVLSQSGSSQQQGTTNQQGTTPPQSTTPPQGTPPKTQGPGIHQVSTEIRVPVTVKDGNGDLVATLTMPDFRIFEDNQEQRITDVKTEPYPISAIILLDDSLKPKAQKELQESVRAIAGGFGARDEAAIYRFDQYPEQVTDFIADPDELLTQLGRLQVSGTPTVKADDSTSSPPMPKTNASQAPDIQAAPGTILMGGNGTKSINDAVYAAARILRERPKDRRKIIFLISDGVESRGNSLKFDETVKMLLSADVTVYSIGVGASLIDRVHNVIGRLATSSGGDFFFASNRSDLENLYSRIADEARNQYVLYYSSARVDRVPTYHSIEVRVRLPGLDIHARNGYYSAPRP